MPLLRGTVDRVGDEGRLGVVVPSLDGGELVRDAFGHFPDATEGDPVRVDRDERGRLVVVAWEPATS